MEMNLMETIKEERNVVELGKLLFKRN